MGIDHSIDPDILGKFIAIVGENNTLTRSDEVAPFVSEWRGRYGGNTSLVLKPGCVEDVAAIMKLAYETATPIVPQGGNTGLVGGQMPDQTGTQLVLNLSRLNKVRHVDPLNNTITVDAGCVLEHIQQVAGEHDRLFPLSLGAEGSCQIGGNLSTNAGGVGVLKYGNCRDLCLGLEVVLPQGDIWHGLNKLRKNNTGYDLKNLFIGAEGTLGIITGAVMKLFPDPIDRSTAILAVNTPGQAVAFLHLAQKMSGGLVSSCELMPRAGLEFVLAHIDGTRDPLDMPTPWYVLMEIAGGTEANSLKPITEKICETALDENLISNAVIAVNASQAADFWQLRLALSEVQKMEGASIKNDVSVPLSEIEHFIEQATNLVQAEIPGCRPVPFGHIGDGNIHYNISQPTDMTKEEFLAKEGCIHDKINRLAYRLGGSFSAEHGIGQIKLDFMLEMKDRTEIELMRQLKMTLDPQNLLNPGKVIPGKPE